MPTTSDILKEVRTPKYINTKMGFLKLNFCTDNRITFAGFTRDLRKATPCYGSNSSVYEVAKRALKQIDAVQLDYFCIVVPEFMGLNKKRS